MKFCAKCGMQIPDEAAVCPQCQTPTIEQYTPQLHQEYPKKKLNKLYIVIPITIVITAIITFVATYFILPSTYKPEDNTNVDSSVSDAVGTLKDTDCPEDEYGYHDWGSATCEHPSICLNCGAYKNEKLGYHYFEYDEETDLIACWHCNMLKDDYDNEE